jgi:hypothetical protein
MLLEGAAVVRFANGFVDAFKKKKDFVLVAIYMYSIGKIVFYHLFQTENSDKVCRALCASKPNH